MRIALFGNQNSGKTTLFNALTGNSAHTGNYPGITVSVSEGILRGTNHSVADLPGIYSLKSFSREEQISQEFLKTKPDLIINILDGNCIMRGMYLTIQLMKYKIPMIIALNMIDEVEKNGKIETEKIESELGIKIIPISARNNINIDKLIDAIKKNQGRIPDNKFSKCENTPENIYKLLDGFEKYIHLKNRDKISFADRLLTGKYTGILFMLIILGSIFFLTFSVFGRFLTGIIETGVETVCNKTEILLNRLGASEFSEGLVINGIIKSTGSIISFLPCVLILSFFLSILEDSGYMARVAFIMDAPMSKVGLSGKAIVPLILGCGCSVPALLSCRTLETNRKNTALAVPFVPCSARLPVFMMLATKFYKNPFLIIVLLYVLGFLSALSFSAFSLKNGQPPFLMELPPYRLPKLSYVIKDVLNKTADFLKRTFSVILLAGICVYLLSSLSFDLTFTTENSILAQISKFLLPLFSAFGISSWRCVAALISGISAKEAILSSFSVLNVSTDFFNEKTALAFLIFTALYTPCVATLNMIKKEYGLKEMIKSIFVETFVAFLFASCTYFLMRIF